MPGTGVKDKAGAETEQLSLPQATEHLLEESRMVLPGMQALFGFQLIAVFNQAFSEKLGVLEQRLHLTSIALVVIAIAIIMAPAAYHRQALPHAVSRHFVALATRLILASMVPLALAICLDFYVVASLVLGRLGALALAVLALAIYLCLWFILPHTTRHKRGA